MKATMDKNGVIRIEGETSLEAYALRQFVYEAIVMEADSKRGEVAHWRGSKIIVFADWAGET